MKARLADLEQSSGIKRLPNRTIEGIEDAMSWMIELNMEHQITGLKLTAMEDVLKALRKNPASYRYQPNGAKERREPAHG